MVEHKITSIKRFSQSELDLNEDLEISVADFDFPNYSKFSHSNFWEHFSSKVNVNNEIELAVEIIDLSRYHFSPKVANLPGFELTLSYMNGSNEAEKVHNYTKGIGGKISPDRGKGKVMSYTNICLATAGVFLEVFHSSEAGREACQKIPGNWNGYTQYMNLVDGWDEVSQSAVEANFEAFVTSNSLSKRDPIVDAKIKSAVRNSISNRDTIGCCLSLKGIIALIMGMDARLFPCPRVDVSVPNLSNTGKSSKTSQPSNPSTAAKTSTPATNSAVAPVIATVQSQSSGSQTSTKVKNKPTGNVP